jgi:hypothetical protein
MTVGNDNNTPFWESRWLNGQAPKQLAPNLYQAAKFKTRSVYTELKTHNWIKNLRNRLYPLAR